MQNIIIQIKQKKFTYAKYRQTIRNALGIILVALLLVSCGESIISEADSGSGSISFVLAITIDPARIAFGDNIALTASIQNNGEATLDSVTLNIYKSSDAAISTSDTSLENISIASIAAGEKLDFTRNIRGHSAGTLYYGACLDISGYTITNCTRGVGVEVILPDLTIARFLAPLLITSSADIRLTARVQNIGDATSAPASLRFYRSSDNTINSNDEFLTAIPLANIPVDASRDFSGNVTGHIAGTMYYGACVDDVSGEVITNNNCSSGVAINAFPIVNVDNTTDNDTLQLLGAISVTTTQIGSATYLFVAGHIESGVSVFEVANNGSLTNVDNTTDGGDLQLDGAFSVTTAQVGSATYLFVAGQGDNGVSVFEVSGDGSLTNVDNITDNTGDLQLNEAFSVTTAQIGSATYLFVAGFQDNGVSVFEVSGDGRLRNVANIEDDANLQLSGSGSVTTAQIGSATYLFVAGYFDNGVSVFEVAGDGSLTNVDNITDNTGDLQLSGAQFVTTAQVGSATYLFVTGESDNGVSVFEVAANGSLINVYNIEDNDELNLAGAYSITTAQIGSATYLFVAGFDDDGISVFGVSGDGSLTNVANIADNDELNLAGTESIATAQIGSATYLFVVGFDDDGLSVFRIDHDNSSSAVSHALNIRRGRSYAGNIASGNSSSTSSGTTFENSENHYRLYLPKGFFTFATKGNLDTFCTLSDAKNTKLATDNDTGEGENCAITYNIKNAGYYLIKVSGHSAADIGNYTLTFLP